MKAMLILQYNKCIGQLDYWCRSFMINLFGCFFLTNRSCYAGEHVSERSACEAQLIGAVNRGKKDRNLAKAAKRLLLLRAPAICCGADSLHLQRGEE
ncbi:MAG TPA: hypothetical protein VE710_09445 [Candidatus Bathyarchaeia archaeon]|nr:hypothetical protein [Candidatus Bathyarchaeia archaeon]